MLKKCESIICEYCWRGVKRGEEGCIDYNNFQCVSNDDGSTRQIQNKINLRDVLWAHETEQPPQNLIFTKTTGHKTPTATAVLKS